MRNDPKRVTRVAKDLPATPNTDYVPVLEGSAASWLEQVQSAQNLPILALEGRQSSTYHLDGDSLHTGAATDTSDPQFHRPPRSGPLRRVLRSWLVLRWKLSRNVFSVPLPFLTVGMDLKLGDLLITLPVITATLIYSVLRAQISDVVATGMPPALAMALVFGFAVRNNAVLLVLMDIPFERALFYHKLFAFVTILLTALHALAFLRGVQEGDQSLDDPLMVTGLGAFFGLVLMYLLSLSFIRRRFFAAFVRVHWLLFIVVVVFAVLHGAGLVVIGVAPWAIDMLFRLVYRNRVYAHGSLFKSNMGVTAREQLSICALPGNITRIQFSRIRQDTGSAFEYQAGQYAFLCVPTISHLQWHPFTISSSPHEAMVTFHIKALGDWTTKLLTAALKREASAMRIEGASTFDILVDGPYGSVSVDMETPTTYSHFVLFSGGIGVTPMRSIVNWLHYECYYRNRGIIPRVHFVWSVRDVETVASLLKQEELSQDTCLEVDEVASYMPHILLHPRNTNSSTGAFFSEVYLTRSNVDEEAQIYPELSKCLRIGSRPDTTAIMRQMGEQALQSGKKRVATPLHASRHAHCDVTSHSTLERTVMESDDDIISIGSPLTTPHVVPILEDSAWSEPGCSWDDDSFVGDHSGEDTADANISIPPGSRRGFPRSGLLRSWLRLRWRLSRRVFSVPIPLLTAELDLKLGDFVLTLPILAALAVVSAFQVKEHNVKGSGLPPTIAMAFVFAFVVRNNSLLVAFTGISFERALFYHKLFAFAMILLTALHGFTHVLARRNDISDQEYRSHKVSTGMIAFTAMVTLYLLSLNFIRRRFFEFFVRVHWVLFIVVLVTAVLHGAIIALVGILPWEIDMIFRIVYRSRVYAQGSLLAKGSKRSSAEFYARASETTSPKAPLKHLGVAARDQVSIYQLPNNVTCIQFPRIRADTGEEFEYKAGQYAFLCVPSLSALEWHPFSMSSSPHEDLVTFHIKAVGDWTTELLQAAPEAPTDGEAPFEILVDGPYGNISIDLESPSMYSHFAIFAGGMGVAPMRSIANWLHNECYFHKGRAIRRLRFVWAMSDSETLRAVMDEDSEAPGRWLTDPTAAYLPDVLLCPTTLNDSTETFFSEFYLTRGLVGAEMELNAQFGKCLWFHCRPDIEEILRDMGSQALQSGKTRVAVLVSGPEAMATEVVVTSLRLSRDLNLHFDVHRESFAF
ncbi:hypothetical protein BBJ28_00006320 [Nothophytophthora sp. Chile5]|nr:hypothetical protein BBJ28_00006320 [Nothophytophthora sp. Chile5]